MAGIGISVIIPSYRNPDYLDLCLNSLFDGAAHPNEMEAIVVLDGYAEESRHIVAKYYGVNVLEFETNRGQMVAHNLGVTNANGNFVLLVNDDNVFPRDWDYHLAAAAHPDWVVAPNQIEPAPSIFKSFVIRNFGLSPIGFKYDEFVKFERETSKHEFQPDGQTWPLLISKKKYMMLGGIDQNYPSAAVADWDFFMRCELAGLEIKRYMGAQFYHFAGAATRKKDTNWNAGEAQSFEYFKYKWGFLPPTHPITHSHFPTEELIRGIRYAKD